MPDYNALAIEHDLYASFVGSKEWDKKVSSIRRVSRKAADAVEKYGIGEQIRDDGQYDFESGQLIQCWPNEIRESEWADKAHDAICRLASAYAEYVVSMLPED